MENDIHFSWRSPPTVRLKEVRDRQALECLADSIVFIYFHTSQFVPAFVHIQLSFTNVTLVDLQRIQAQHQIQVKQFLWTLPPVLAIAYVLIFINNLLLYITGGYPLIVPWHKI